MTLQSQSKCFLKHFVVRLQQVCVYTYHKQEQELHHLCQGVIDCWIQNTKKVDGLPVYMGRTSTILGVACGVAAEHGIAEGVDACWDGGGSRGKSRLCK